MIHCKPAFTGHRVVLVWCTTADSAHASLGGHHDLIFIECEAVLVQIFPAITAPLVRVSRVVITRVLGACCTESRVFPVSLVVRVSTAILAARGEAVFLIATLGERVERQTSAARRTDFRRHVVSNRFAALGCYSFGRLFRIPVGAPSVVVERTPATTMCVTLTCGDRAFKLGQGIPPLFRSGA